MKQLFNNIRFVISFLVVGLFISSCRREVKLAPLDFELATAWADMSTYITKTTPANSPTFASRCFGYIGLTMYESVVNGFPEYASVAPQLNGLGNLPVPEKDLQYNWQLALNAGQAEIIRNIYIQTSDKNKAKIDSLENDFVERISGTIHVTASHISARCRSTAQDRCCRPRRWPRRERPEPLAA